jgi:predicted RNA-binding Zn-ribbon protein involved in translation (DUF1610 family)
MYKNLFIRRRLRLWKIRTCGKSASMRLDRVSGGSGENPRDNTGTCPICGNKHIKPILWWSDGRVKYICNKCGLEWTE